jgi:hypothetical protein
MEQSVATLSFVGNTYLYQKEKGGTSCRLSLFVIRLRAHYRHQWELEPPLCKQTKPHTSLRQVQQHDDW